MNNPFDPVHIQEERAESRISPRTLSTCSVWMLRTVELER